jgi:hypothetical protein
VQRGCKVGQLVQVRAVRAAQAHRLQGSAGCWSWQRERQRDLLADDIEPTDVVDLADRHGHGAGRRGLRLHWPTAVLTRAADDIGSTQVHSVEPWTWTSVLTIVTRQGPAPWFLLGTGRKRSSS